MNKVQITISIYKNDDMTFFHVHSFSNLNIEYDSDKSLVLDYLARLDNLVNPKHSFLSVFEVLVSTAFIESTSSMTFKNFQGENFQINVCVIR